MSFTSLTDYSLSKIFDCIWEEASTSTKFLQTNYAIYNYAKKNERVPGISHVYEVGISRLPASRQICIVIEPKQNQQFPIIQDSEFGLSLINNDTSKSTTTAVKGVANAFRNRGIKSCTSIAIYNCEFDAELLHRLLDLSSKPIEYLILDSCVSNCSGNELFEVLRRCQLKGISINLQNDEFRVNDLHISMVIDHLIMQLFHKHWIIRRMARCTDITDQTLTNWLYKTPTKVDLQMETTSFTLKGVLRFIKDLSEKLSNSMEDRAFSLGSLKYDDEFKTDIAVAQRIPGLKGT